MFIKKWHGYFLIGITSKLFLFSILKVILLTSGTFFI